MKLYNKHNFHKYTFCIFNEVTSSAIEHLKTNFISKSGSSYIFTDEGVYRKSDHWGRAANCKWRLQSTSKEASSRTKIGFAPWSHFHPINEVDKLYCIEVDYEQKTVQYQHKNTAQNKEILLRNATETAKRIKEIRHLFLNDKKLQYWETAMEPEELLQTVIHYFVATNFTLLEIKKIITT